MVPDGVSPQLHKMFITHGVYEPEKPSRNLQRKSSTFSYRSGKYSFLHLRYTFVFLLFVSRSYIDLFYEKINIHFSML